MIELTERDMVAIDAAVKVLKDTTYRDDPVLLWTRGIDIKFAFSNVARINVVFWPFRSPDTKQIVSVILGKKSDEEGWMPYAAFLKLDNKEVLSWDFNENGIPMRT